MSRGRLVVSSLSEMHSEGLVHVLQGAVASCKFGCTLQSSDRSLSPGSRTNIDTPTVLEMRQKRDTGGMLLLFTFLGV